MLYQTLIGGCRTTSGHCSWISAPTLLRPRKSDLARLADECRFKTPGQSAFARPGKVPLLPGGRAALSSSERLLPALRVTRRPCRIVGMTVHVRLSAEASIHLSAEVGADISAYTGSIIAQVSADLGDDASADAGGNITHT